MNLLALHIYHLDDDEEADAVIALLTDAGVELDWKIERPNEDTNAILLPITLDDDGTEPYQIRLKKLEIAVARLRNLRPEPISAIRELDLDTAMRIHTSEDYLPLDSDFVRECGRLGLEICVFNEGVF